MPDEAFANDACGSLKCVNTFEKKCTQQHDPQSRYDYIIYFYIHCSKPSWRSSLKITDLPAFLLNRLFIFNLFLVFFEPVVSSRASNVQLCACFTWCQTFLVHKNIFGYKLSFFLFGYRGTSDPSAHPSLSKANGSLPASIASSNPSTTWCFPSLSYDWKLVYSLFLKWTRHRLKLCSSMPKDSFDLHWIWNQKCMKKMEISQFDSEKGKSTVPG